MESCDCATSTDLALKIHGTFGRCAGRTVGLELTTDVAACSNLNYTINSFEAMIVVVVVVHIGL